MTEFGRLQMPGERNNVTGAPNTCPACGAVGTPDEPAIGIFHNLDTDTLSLECVECGAEYDDDGRAYDVLFGLLAVGNGTE